MIDVIKGSFKAKVILLVFFLLTAWWLYLQAHTYQKPQFGSFGKFGDIYGVVALLGGIWGVFISRKWGGMGSIIGKAILFFSLGLFAQEFGQLAYSIYDDFISVNVPYPSIGDIGFFGSIPLYITGTLFFAKAAGAHIKLKEISSKIQAVLIPLVMLSITYYLFLQNYKFDWSHPLTIFLDFGYPFGEAIYISLAALTFLLSNGILGGFMKSKVLFLLFALCVQFSADYNFLFQVSRGTWVANGYGDFLYLLAYFIMTLGILQFETALQKVNSKSE